MVAFNGSTQSDFNNLIIQNESTNGVDFVDSIRVSADFTYDGCKNTITGLENLSILGNTIGGECQEKPAVNPAVIMYLLN